MYNYLLTKQDGSVKCYTCTLYYFFARLIAFKTQKEHVSRSPRLGRFIHPLSHYHVSPPPDSKYLVTDYTQSCKIILVNSHCRNGNRLAITNTGNGLKPELVTLQSASMTQTVAQRSQNYLFSGDKMTRLQCQHSKMDGCSRSARMEV